MHAALHQRQQPHLVPCQPLDNGGDLSQGFYLELADAAGEMRSSFVLEDDAQDLSGGQGNRLFV